MRSPLTAAFAALCLAACSQATGGDAPSAAPEAVSAASPVATAPAAARSGGGSRAQTPAPARPRPAETPPGQGPVPRGAEMSCTMDYTPVCGADGKTYGNACVARSSGTTVASQGECRSGG